MKTDKVELVKNVKKNVFYFTDENSYKAQPCRILKIFVFEIF